MIVDGLSVVATVEPVECLDEGACGSSERPLADNSPLAPVDSAAEPTLRPCRPRRAGGVGEGERPCRVCGCGRGCA